MRYSELDIQQPEVDRAFERVMFSEAETLLRHRTMPRWMSDRLKALWESGSLNELAKGYIDLMEYEQKMHPDVADPHAMLVSAMSIAFQAGAEAALAKLAAEERVQ